MRTILCLIAATLLGATSCAPPSDTARRAPLTERERDSLIARSSLPGATVVGRAMVESDSAAARAARVDAGMPSEP